MSCKTCLFFILFFTFSYVGAQRLGRYKARTLDELFLKDGCFSVNGGVSFPIGEFSENNVSNVFKGYAKTGYTFNAALSYAIIPTIGVTVSYIYNRHPIDDPARERDLEASGGEQYVFQSAAYSELYGFMGGLYYCLRSANTSTEIRAMAGYLSSTMPDLNVYVTPSALATSTTDSLFFAGANTRNWAGSIGIGVKRRIYNDLLLTIYGDFLFSDQVYKDRFAYWQNVNGAVPLDNLIQPFRILNFTLGLAYQFN